MSRVDLGHVSLNTSLDGPEGAPWIVLSNSLGANLSMWDPQMPLLTARYRVMRYDTRGHGGSDARPGPYSLKQLQDDIIALMDQFAIEGAAYMGLSMGAMCGMGLALSHPERFERMVLADGRADAPAPFRQMWDDRIAKVEGGGLEAIADATLATWLTEAFRDAHPDQVARVRAMIVGNDPQGYVACCRALQRLDYLRQLGGVTVPCLYIGGSHDMGAPPDVMRAMAAATPGAQHKEIPGAAHVANINAPEAFNAAIAEFLGL